MNIVLGLVLIATNLYVFRKNSDNGLCLFTFLMCVSPVINVAGFAMGYDIVFFPFFLLLLVERKIKNVILLRLSGIELCLYIWYVMLLLTTLISVISLPNITVNVISLFGNIRRLIILSVLLRQCVIQNKFLTIFRAIVFANVIAMIVEYTLMQILSPSQAVEIWLKLYGTIGSSGSLLHILETGALGRLYGASASSSIVGMVSVAGLAIYLTEYKKEKNWKSIISILACLFCGIGSSTKRFYLGLLLVVVYAIILHFKRQPGGKKKHSFKFPILIIGSLGSMVILINYFRDSLSVDYYLNYLLNLDILNAFSTRFGESGAVNSMKNVLLNNIVLGVGDITEVGINATDSQFYVLLYRTGVLGLILFVITFYNLLRRAIKSKEFLKLFILGQIVLEFLISTQFFSPIGILLLAYVGNNYYKGSYIERRGLPNESTNTVDLCANIQ